MTPLDLGNLACERHLIHADPDYRVPDRDRPPPPATSPTGPRDRRDGLWSRSRDSFDTVGRELACATHADGHSVMWLDLDPSDAFLIAPSGAVVHTPEAYAEARDYAEYRGAP